MSLPNSKLPSRQPERPLPIATILVTPAKGMTPRELVPSDHAVQAIIDKARRHSNLSEDEAMERAVKLTREVRRERAATRRAR